MAAPQSGERAVSDVAPGRQPRFNPVADEPNRRRSDRAPHMTADTRLREVEAATRDAVVRLLATIRKCI